VNHFSARFTLVVMIVCASLIASAGMPKRSEGAADQPLFSGTAISIEDVGTHGQYGLIEPPGVDPVTCEGTPVGDGEIAIFMSDSEIFVKPTPGITQQAVDLIPQLFQRLADGSLVLLQQRPAVPFIVLSEGRVEKIPGWGHLPAGPDYILAVRINWRDSPGPPGTGNVTGHATVGFSKYIQGGNLTSICSYPLGPYPTLSATSGTVNSTLDFTLHRYPLGVTVPITWDGVPIGSVATNDQGQGPGSLKIPASPMGKHTLRFVYGHWTSAISYTVKPRIKITPSQNVKRDQTVNVSLRGFAKQEVIRIRWKKGSSWVEIARVTTSSTGSANKDIRGPSYAVVGTNSVRGDGSAGHAQTNAVTVSGGPGGSSAAKASPSPTKTPMKTPQPTATTAPIQPTEVATTPATEPPTQEATSAPTETATPSPTDIPTEAPTEIPSETPTNAPTATVPPAEQTVATGG
jgi:hypothetical protein